MCRDDQQRLRRRRQLGGKFSNNASIVCTSYGEMKPPMSTNGQASPPWGTNRTGWRIDDPSNDQMRSADNGFTYCPPEPDHLGKESDLLNFGDAACCLVPGPDPRPWSASPAPSKTSEPSTTSDGAGYRVRTGDIQLGNLAEVCGDRGTSW